jgi:hypothetical protein
VLEDMSRLVLALLLLHATGQQVELYTFKEGFLGFLKVLYSTLLHPHH